MAKETKTQSGTSDDRDQMSFISLVKRIHRKTYLKLKPASFVKR